MNVLCVEYAHASERSWLSEGNTLRRHRCFTTGIPVLNTGLDRLLKNTTYLGFLQKQRVGFLGHAASVTASYVHAIDALTAAGVRPVRLFGPEHGLRGEAQMMVAVADAVDPLSGIPIQSLYGDDEASLAPRREAVADLAVILIDVQDVGSRYYTYAATALKLATLATELGVNVIVLDRPNPLGRLREGAGIEPGFHSFVGELAVPNRHGLTIAELFNWALQQGTKLYYEVISMEGWDNSKLLSEDAFAWAMPSPNMPTMNTALVYPGGCLLEATNVSEGRGTTRPFELFGAPWVDAKALLDRLNEADLPGVLWRMASFMPTFDKFQGEVCQGLQLHVYDKSAFRPLRSYASVLLALKQLHPEHFGWRPGAYEFVEDIPAIDLLAGSPALRGLIESESDFEQIAQWSLCPEELDASCRRAEHYDDTH